MRILPQRRWLRALTIVVMLAVYSAIMWWTLFPWIDRTYVNRPAFDDETVQLTPSPTPAPTDLLGPFSSPTPTP